MRPTCAVLLALLCPGLLRAHDPGLSTTEVAILPAAIRLTVGFAPADLARLDRSNAATFFWAVEGADGPLGATDLRRTEAVPASVLLQATFPRPAGGRVRLRALGFDRLPPGHRDYLTVTDEAGRLIVEKLVGAADAPIAFDLASSPGRKSPPAFFAFLRLGVAHIWTGYDHLLFLFGLLVVCGRLRSILAIISSFTLAHSLTLGLATLNLVHLPGRIVEPAIAASIAFVGVENILRRGAAPAGRAALTFLFGLVHGFGFASVLRDLGVGSGGRGVLLPLVSFNLGVEAGQIAVALIVLPLVWELRRRPAFLRRGIPALSALVAAAGLFWFFQRTLFS